jgi:hypothetical protein
MNDDQKADLVVFFFYGAFGAFLGLLIFMFALGGSDFVFSGDADKPWNGPVALVICCVLGGGWGFISYTLSEREFGKRESRFFHDPATAILFAKRVMVIATCLAGVYFIWQLAKGL